MTEEDSCSVNRRKILKGIGVTATATSFTAAVHAGPGSKSSSDQQSGTKTEKLDQVQAEYEDRELVDEYINQYSTFVNRLAKDGLLKQKKVEVQELLSSCEYLESNEGARVWGIDHPRDGVPTAHVTIRRKTKKGRLTIAFNPGRDDTRPRAVVKPKIPESGSKSVLATRYRVIEGGDVEKAKTEIIPKRPGELETTDSGGVSTSGEFSTQSKIAYLCRNRSSTNCGDYQCYSWETECYDETSCNVVDCTGTKCCEGCCCCQDQDRCCTICGSSSQCYEPPGCYPNSYQCCAGGGCTDCCY